MANQENKDKIIEKENGDNNQWRPTNEQTKGHSEKSTGVADKSPAEQIGEPGRTPGKAKCEDFEEQ